MGGTSFDVAMVRDGASVMMTDGVVAEWPLALPMIDIHTIGAGGGSIATVDEGGLLHVGPQSAGAEPGPAAYGRGGTLPTVTDADLVLGYLSADNPLAGGMRLDVEAARTAFAPVADALGRLVEEAAAGVYDLVNVNMATGVRDVTVRRGLDPRDFPVVVAGGAGTACTRPRSPPSSRSRCSSSRASRRSSAPPGCSCATSSTTTSARSSVPWPTSGPRSSTALLEGLADAGRATLHGEGVADAAISFKAALDLRYVGQWHELQVPLDWEPGGAPAIGDMEDRFHAEHDRTFGYASSSSAIECLAVRLSAVGATPQVDLSDLDEMAEGRVAPSGRRATWSPGSRAMVDTPVYDGHGLQPGFEVAGPAIVELATTTIVLLEGFDLVVDRRGAFLLCAGERGRTLAAQLAPEAVT